VTAPSGTGFQLPVITWTEVLAGGTSQINFRALIYPAAVIAGGGFVAGTTPGWVYDSGVVTSAALTVTCTTLLAIGSSYTAYVQINETGPEASLWTGGSAFTVTSSL